MDAQTQLADAFNSMNTFPVTPHPNMRGSNKRKSGTTQSATHTPSQMEWLVIHMRKECHLKSIRYVSDLSKRIMEGSNSVLLQHLKANSGALGRIKALHNWVAIEMTDLKKEGVDLRSEEDVNAHWLLYCVQNAKKILGFLIPKDVGFVDVGRAACDLLSGDRIGLTPTPDGIFYLYPEGGTSTETPQIIDGEAQASPLLGQPEMRARGRLMIATWETKPPFHNPSLLKKFQDLLDVCKESFVGFKMPETNESKASKITSTVKSMTLETMDEPWGQRRLDDGPPFSDDVPFLDSILCLPSYSSVTPEVLVGSQFTNNMHYLIHQVWCQMLFSNVSIGYLTDYDNLYVFVRRRKTNTLYISDPIKHNATDPSVICTLVASTLLAIHDWKHRTGDKMELVSYRSDPDPPAPDDQGREPRDENKEPPKEDDEEKDPQPSVRGKRRRMDSQTATYPPKSGINTYSLAPVPQAWPWGAFYPARRLGKQGPEKRSRPGGVTKAERIPLPKVTPPVIGLIFRTSGWLSSTFASALLLDKPNINHADYISNIPLVVLLDMAGYPGAVGTVWRGYLDHPAHKQAFAIVGKLGDLAVLQHEVKIYERIAEYGGIPGVPTLIGLYAVESTKLGFLIQSDCGDPLPEGEVQEDVKSVYSKILQDLHQCGVIHGDIRRNNLLRTNKGMLSIIDFHLSTIVSPPVTQDIIEAEQHDLELALQP